VFHSAPDNFALHIAPLSPTHIPTERKIYVPSAEIYLIFDMKMEVSVFFLPSACFYIACRTRKRAHSQREREQEKNCMDRYVRIDIHFHNIKIFQLEMSEKYLSRYHPM
jgi:hypothetical protein